MHLLSHAQLSEVDISPTERSCESVMGSSDGKASFFPLYQIYFGPFLISLRGETEHGAFTRRLHVLL